MNTNTSLSLPSIKTILAVSTTVAAMAILSTKLVHAGDAPSQTTATSVAPMRAVQTFVEETSLSTPASTNYYDGINVAAIAIAAYDR